RAQVPWRLAIGRDGNSTVGLALFAPAQMERGTDWPRTDAASSAQFPGRLAVRSYYFIMLHLVRRALTRFGEFTTHPAAFAVVASYAVAWLIASPETFGWAEIATLATWFMTLFINRTAHRDTEAIHAKSMSCCGPMVRLVLI